MSATRMVKAVLVSRHYWVRCRDCEVLLSLGAPHRRDRFLVRDGLGHLMRDDGAAICEAVVGGDE